MQTMKIKLHWLFALSMVQTANGSQVTGYHFPVEGTNLMRLTTYSGISYYFDPNQEVDYTGYPVMLSAEGQVPGGERTPNRILELQFFMQRALAPSDMQAFQGQALNDRETENILSLTVRYSPPTVKTA